MKRVILESPFKGNILISTDKQGIDAAIDIYESKIMLEEFKRYAQRCVLDCLKRNESPNVSHLLFPQVLDDNIPEIRKLGIKAGFAWYESADYCVIYMDYGITAGMQKGIEYARKIGLKIIHRALYA